ncbi:protein translocase subunit SecD [Desulfobotulus sp. H1]|uniref:Protein translocase subunit SecD n=1 Tax=Desulfobotulus pelophilus TaxID=2823377 RepID=A0ABT3N656_9BACT|nr:protein translocase subunit SecD [Desulfobotulus pelophilus]MCW7752938.1 protein translocase subunit SecD [Desulfobotulus pelophilus]
MKVRSWRFYAVCVALILAIIYILPSFQPGLWPYKTINLGLDLQGGMHLVLDVEVEKALESTMERRTYELRDQLRKERIRYTSVRQLPDGSIAVRLADTADANAFSEFHRKEFPDMTMRRHTVDQDIEFRFSISAEEKAHIEKMATEQALETIRNRIDEFGVNEPDIRIQGERRITIQLPGIEDPERAKDLIGKTALLEFKIVDDSYDVQDALDGRIPPGTELLYEIRRDAFGQETGRIPYLVKRRAVLTGASLTDARVQVDSQFNEAYVSISFDRQGARQFERITGENIHKRMAIVLDNNVYSAPVIQDRISGGSARITGSFNMESARDLAIVLRAGALPAPVRIIEERTVGPTLGAESIQKGLLSMMVGGGLVLLFMAIYYKGAGLMANLALVLNILFIASALAAFGATLTLPGIAGMVLTLGMAVDANVLIFERIREELRLGRSPIAAIHAGFDRATLTILDANVTTLIAALVLFQFGTGPVKGFAVTLCLGVLSSMFTALVMVRLIFDFLYDGKHKPVTQISI